MICVLECLLIQKQTILNLKFLKNVFYFVENQCKRLPIHEAITIPLVKDGSELPQLIIDLQFSKAITWSTAIILHDDSISNFKTN